MCSYILQTTSVVYTFHIRIFDPSSIASISTNSKNPSTRCFLPTTLAFLMSDNESLVLSINGCIDKRAGGNAEAKVRRSKCYLRTGTFFGSTMARRSSTLSSFWRNLLLLSATAVNSAVSSAKMSSAVVRSDASCFNEVVNAPFATASNSAPTGQPCDVDPAGTCPRHKKRGSTLRSTNGMISQMKSSNTHSHITLEPKSGNTAPRRLERETPGLPSQICDAYRTIIPASYPAEQRISGGIKRRNSLQRL